MNLVGDTLQAASGAIVESEVGPHSFRIKVTDTAAASVTADVSVDVRPYGFTRAYDFLLDPKVFELVQAYLSGNQTPEKVQKHFFRDISGSYLHLSRDILVEDWLGLFPFHAAADEGLRDVLNSFANDLLYFANPLKYRVTSVVPGPGAFQVTYTLPSTKGAFIGRVGETDASMARKWFRLVDCDSEDEPEDGDGNPLTIITITDANGVEIDPNTFSYQANSDGFHTGQDAGGAPIGYDLTFIVEYVPNPSSKVPPTPWCMRYGERAELHEVDPEAFIKFGNVLGEVDADVIALIKSAPFVGGIRVGSTLVKPVEQEIIFQGQNGLDIEGDVINGLIRIIAPDSVRTINQVPTAGAGDIELRDGEFIEIESEVDEGHLTIKTTIPIQAKGSLVAKGLISELDYGRFLELIGRDLVRMHEHTGEDLRLGLPGDGSWSDGWLPFDADATIPDTLDRLNEALATVLPPAIVGLDADVGWLADPGPPVSIDFDLGFLANDGGIVYPAAYPAGSEAPYVYNAGQFPPPSVVVTSTEFYVTGAEVVDMLINGVSYTGGVGFPIPPLPAPTPIVISPEIQISSIRPSGVGYYIKVQLLLDLLTPNPAFIPFLVRGYNTFTLNALPPQPGYTGISGNMEIFLDTTPAPSPGGFALPAVVYGDAPGLHVMLSGIDHYSGDNDLLISFTGNNTFQDTYYQKPYQVEVRNPDTNQWQDPKTIDIADLTGVSSPPASVDNPVLTDFSTGRPIKDYSVEQSVPTAYLRLTHMRPGGTFNYDQTVSLTTLAGETILYTLNTADTTDKVEQFEDERYRLNKDDPKWANYTWVPVMVRQTFHWHSDSPLFPGVAPWGDGAGDAGQLQVDPNRAHGAGITAPAEGALVWPSLNYNAGSFKPAQSAGRDYGNDFAATGVCIYDRAFVFKDAPRSHGKFRITGITSADIGQSYLGSGGAPAGNVNLEIKFPGHKAGYFSGWLDLSKLSLGGGNYADGDGCRVGAIVDVILPSGETAVEIDWTGNGLSTVDAGEMIILRVTYRSTLPVIFAIEEIG